MRRSEKSKKPCKMENRFSPSSGTRRRRFAKKSILKTKTLLEGNYQMDCFQWLTLILKLKFLWSRLLLSFGDISKSGKATKLKLESSQEDNLIFTSSPRFLHGKFFLDLAVSLRRAIHPGDVLETAEDGAAKEKCTRHLISEFEKVMMFFT